VQPDFALVTIAASRQAMSWNWQITAPYSATSVTFPALPKAIAQFVPVDGDTTEVSALVNGKAAGGYDAIRARLFAWDVGNEGASPLSNSVTASASASASASPSASASGPRRDAAE
jgi:hypothetical protein